MDNTNVQKNSNDAPLQPNQSEGSGVDNENKASTEAVTPNPDTKTEDPSDRLTEDHPRFKDVLQKSKEQEATIQSLTEKLDAIQESITQRQQSTGEEELTDEERSSLEKIDRQLRKKGYVTKTDLESSADADRVANALDKLSDKYDGKDGSPKFDATEVVAFAKRNGYPVSKEGLESAYKEMHFDARVAARAKKAPPEIPGSEQATGGERKAPVEFSPAQIAAMSDAEWEANREKILGQVKTSAQ